MRRARISVTDHVRIGAELVHVWGLVRQLASAAQNSYGKTTGATRHAFRALERVERLRLRLEDDYELAAGREFAHATYNSDAAVPLLKVPRVVGRGRPPGRLSLDEHRDLAAHLRETIERVILLHRRIQRHAGNIFVDTITETVFRLCESRNALDHRLFGEHRITGIYDDPSVTVFVKSPPGRELWRAQRGDA